MISTTVNCKFSRSDTLLYKWFLYCNFVSTKLDPTVGAGPEEGEGAGGGGGGDLQPEEGRLWQARHNIRRPPRRNKNQLRVQVREKTDR